MSWLDRRKLVCRKSDLCFLVKKRVAVSRVLVTQTSFQMFHQTSLGSLQALVSCSGALYQNRSSLDDLDQVSEPL